MPDLRQTLQEIIDGGYGAPRPTVTPQFNDPSRNPTLYSGGYRLQANRPGIQVSPVAPAFSATSPVGNPLPVNAPPMGPPTIVPDQQPMVPSNGGGGAAMPVTPVNAGGSQPNGSQPNGLADFFQQRDMPRAAGVATRVGDWAGSDRGQNFMTGIAGGLYGINQPAMTGLGAFAQGFGQAIAAQQARQQQEAAGAAATAAAAEQTAYDRRLDERIQSREDALASSLIQDRLGADVTDPSTLSNLGLNEDQLEAFTDDYNSTWARIGSDYGLRQGTLTSITGLPEEEQQAMADQLATWALGQVNDYRRLNGLPPLASLEGADVPEPGPGPDAWGGRGTPPPPNAPPAIDDNGAIYQHIPDWAVQSRDAFMQFGAQNGWIEGLTIFYDPRTGQPMLYDPNAMQF